MLAVTAVALGADLVEACLLFPERNLALGAAAVLLDQLVGLHLAKRLLDGSAHRIDLWLQFFDGPGQIAARREVGGEIPTVGCCRLDGMAGERRLRFRFTAEPVDFGGVARGLRLEGGQALALTVELPAAEANEPGDSLHGALPRMSPRRLKPSAIAVDSRLPWARNASRAS
jgi:hypothetical protein